MFGKQSSSVSVKEVMDQAQVYACTWSCVDGPFDAGDTLERAQNEKYRLQWLVERLAFERDQYRDSMQELSDRIDPDIGRVIGIKEDQYPKHLRARPREDRS